MNRDKILSIFLAVLMVGSVFAAFATPAAAQGQGEINVTLTPQNGEAQPGQAQTYEVIVEGADNGIKAFQLDVNVGDTNVGEISGATVNDTDGSIASSADISADNSTVTYQVATGNDPYSASDSIQIGTVDVEAVGNIGDNTALSFANVDVQDQDGNTYTVNAQNGANFDIPEQANFDVSNLQPQQATVDERQDFTVSATIENTGGQAGEQDIELRAEPNGAVLATESGVQLDPGESTDVEFTLSVDNAGTYNHTVASEDDMETGSLTVEERPANIDDDDLGVKTVDVADSDKSIIGNAALPWFLDVVGDPAQHQDNFNNFVHNSNNIQVLNNQNQPNSFGTVSQTITVETDIGSDKNDVDTELTIDYQDASDAFLSAANLQLKQQGQDSDLAGAVQDIQFRRDASEIAVIFDASQFNNQRVSQQFTVTFSGNPVFIGNDKNDDVLRHGIEVGGVTKYAKYRLTAAGATGISPTDAQQNGFDLTNDIDENNLQESLDGSTGVYDIHRGQTISFAVNNPDNEIQIWEYETTSSNNNDFVRRGSKIAEIGTAPGSVTNFNTLRFDANERYLIDYPGTNRYLILDIDPLNFSADFAENEVPADQPVDLNLNSEDTSGAGTVSAFFEEGDLLGDIIHTAPTDLTGDGDALITVNATADLNGVESYQAAALHNESEVPAYTGILDVVEPLDKEMKIMSPRPDNATYYRGDIIPIKLEFQNTDTGTLTFGDREGGQDLEINVTVTDQNGDGEATIYLNTFQIGAGHVRASQQAASGNPNINAGDLIPARNDPVTQLDPGQGLQDPRNLLPYAPGVNTRNHGFFTRSGDVSVDLAVAHRETLDVASGAAGAGVPAGIAYDLVSTNGEMSYKEAGVTVDDRSLINLRQRGTEEFNVWTAPGTGENMIDPEFVSDIEEKAGTEEGDTITPAQNSIADEDFMVLEIESTGLEGMLHESIIINQTAGTGDLDLDDLFDRSEDHMVTGPWFETSQLRTLNGNPVGTPVLQTSAVEADPGPNKERFRVALREAGVIAGTNDMGNLNRYYVPIRLDDDSTPTIGQEPMTVGSQIQSSFTINLFGLVGSQADMVNLPLVDYVFNQNNQPVSNESTTVTFDFLDDTADVTREGDRLDVPQEDMVEIAGKTNVAAGTNLTVNLVTTAGQDDPFFKPNTAIVQYNDSTQANDWSIMENFSDQRPGTEFEINIIRAGAAGTITPSGQKIPGIVSAEPAVNNFVFNDQQIGSGEGDGGQSLVINTFNTTQGGYVAIEMDGERIGLSSYQGIGERTGIPISLTSTIEEETELTAVAMRSKDRPYMEDGERVTTTATITPREQTPASFQVSNLSPTEATATVGDTVTVTATVTNTGDQEGTTTATLMVGGSEQDSQEVTIAGGESTTVTLEASAGQAGTFLHKVTAGDSEAAGQLTVEAQQTATATATETATETATATQTATETATEQDTATETESGDDGGPGFGVVVAMLAFLGAALLAARRQTRE